MEKGVSLFRFGFRSQFCRRETEGVVDEGVDEFIDYFDAFKECAARDERVKWAVLMLAETRFHISSFKTQIDIEGKIDIEGRMDIEERIDIKGKIDIEGRINIKRRIEF